MGIVSKFPSYHLYKETASSFKYISYTLVLVSRRPLSFSLYFLLLVSLSLRSSSKQQSLRNLARWRSSAGSWAIRFSGSVYTQLLASNYFVYIPEAWTTTSTSNCMTISCWTQLSKSSWLIPNSRLHGIDSVRLLNSPARHNVYSWKWHNRFHWHQSHLRVNSKPSLISCYLVKLTWTQAPALSSQDHSSTSWISSNIRN